MSKPGILQLALREIDFSDDKKSSKSKKSAHDEQLECAMREFSDAKTPELKARAFKAALKLANSKQDADSGDTN